MKTLVIIPAYNEEKNIEKVIDDLKVYAPQYDYVIINDCSSDNTAEICKKNNYNVINLPINLGIGGCVQTGYKYALKNNYDFAIQMDADGQHDPSYLKDLIEHLKNKKADIVIGSRFINNEGFKSSKVRRFGIRFLSNLIYLCSKERIIDVTSGYRAVNKKFIEIYSKDYADDYPEPEAIIASTMYQGKIKEIPVIMHERASGKSSINALKPIYYMIKVSLSILIYRITFKGEKNYG